MTARSHTRVTRRQRRRNRQKRLALLRAQVNAGTITEERYERIAQRIDTRPQTSETA